MQTWVNVQLSPAVHDGKGLGGLVMGTLEILVSRSLITLEDSGPLKVSTTVRVNFTLPCSCRSMDISRKGFCSILWTGLGGLEDTGLSALALDLSIFRFSASLACFTWHNSDHH